MTSIDMDKVKFTLTIDKKEVKFHVGIGFLGEYTENYGSIDETIDKAVTNPFKYIPHLMYHSALYASDGKLDFDLKGLTDMIDRDGSIFNKGYKEFWSNFVEATLKNVPNDKFVDDDDDDDAKKK